MNLSPSGVVEALIHCPTVHRFVYCDIRIQTAIQANDNFLDSYCRILCELLGGWVESGRYPNDEKQLRSLVEDICFHNTNAFFRFDV